MHRFDATLACAVVAVLAGTAPQSATAQTAGGAQVFERACASCHTATAPRAPGVDVLKTRTPQAIIESLVTGAMRVQGARLSGAERRAVAEFITGSILTGDVSGTSAGRCTAASAFTGASAGPRWTGWSPVTTNARLQPADQAGLTAATIPKLTLKWAFGFPDATVAWAHPTVAGGRVFVGSQNGTVYSLDAKSGCIRWTYSASGGVRTAVTIGATLVYFGDTAANVYALDADTGREVWKHKADDHPLARITGSPTLHEGRLYVPMSSYEEAQGADPQYGCCTFRGSVTAMDAMSGAVAWKTSLVSEPLQRRGTSTAGVPLWGPSGSAVWSAPTVDPARRRLYVATGNAYSGPAPSTSNAVVALALDGGSIAWVKQVTPNDVYISNCRQGNPNCPEASGPDVDFGSPPMLVRTASGRDVIVIGQKSGVGYAMDPERNGEVLWQYRAGRGGLLGGIEWGSAVDGERAYFAVSDITHPEPGGLHGVALETGQRVWMTPAPPLACAAGRGCNGAQSAALTVVPGAVFSGSVDGALRVYSDATGALLWEFNANRAFQTVNGVVANGASMLGPGPAVAGGMVFVNSGYGAFNGRAGNVLLAFGIE